MNMESMNCPHCGFTLKKAKKPFFIQDFLLGSFDALVCDTCKRVYRPREASEQIEKYAKELGLWETEKETTQNIEVIYKDAEEESGTNFPPVATTRVPLAIAAKGISVEFKGHTKPSGFIAEYRTSSQTSNIARINDVRADTYNPARSEL